MKTGFIRHSDGEVVYYTVSAIENTNIVRHGMSTRLGGVSEDDVSSLNLGFHKESSRENVMKNYETICKKLGIEHKKLVLSNQVHEKRVWVIDESDIGKGIVRESDIVGVDAFVCNKKGIPFVIFCADCVPVFFVDPVKKAAGLAHSGWRSTVKNISAAVIEKMRNEFASVPKDIICAIGPSIGSCCFEVDADVADLFEEDYKTKKSEKYHIDLWKMIYEQLLSCGVKDENITCANICTCCNNDEFFSSRAQNGKMGLMGAFMEIV